MFYPERVRNFWITIARFKKKDFVQIYWWVDDLYIFSFSSFDYFIEHYFEIVLFKSIILRFYLNFQKDKY